MLIPFKMGHKAAEITCNINTFGWGTANERTVQWCFKKFCKGDESLEDEEHSGWHQKLTTTNWEQSPKLILLQRHEKLLKKSMSTPLQPALKANWKAEKTQCCLMSWLKKKKRLFWSLGFSYSVQQWTISQLDCDIQWKVDFIRQPVVTSSVAELRSSKALLKVKPAAEKDHGQSLVISCQSGPL